MILLINELKRLHRFNNSLIIFHADHGWSEVDFQYPDLSDIPENVTHKIQQSINCTPTRFLHRSHALLLIKPPGTDGQQPLEISDRLTQLSDIPATICHLLNLNFSSHHGLPLFSEKRNGKREIHLFAGLHKYNKLGLKCDFGKHFFKGLLAHFSIKQDNYWKIHPDLPISWH
jgi:arylsulfatase A-like enzyme